MPLSTTVSEHTHQVNVIRWFDLKYKEFKGRLFAVPNGGQRHIKVAVKLKAEGVRRGVPDLMLPIPRGGYHGLFVEMKKEKGKLTEEQADWRDFLVLQGYTVCLCHGRDEAVKSISDYLELI